jgi:hypothetical protein
MIEVVKLETIHVPLIEQFCKECSVLGYNNNSSISAMKFGATYDLGEVPTFFGAIINGELAAVSGNHSIGSKKLRCGFRGAALPKFNNIIKGLSKTHMTNLTWAPLMPESIIDGLGRGFEEFYITTSHTDHDASGRMHKMHRVMTLLAKQDILEHHGEIEFYHTPQTLWKFNLPRFFETVKAFHPIRNELNIIPYKYNLDIVNHLISG